MRRLSPSSRLVLAAVVTAVVVLAIVGSARPAQPLETPIPFTGAAASASPSGAISAAPPPAGVTESPAISAAAESTPSTPASTTSPTTTARAPATSRPPTTPQPIRTATPRPTPTATPRSTTTAACTPTDQDQYVYHPGRLEVLEPCIRVTGTVDAIRNEADGDLHILLDLDTPYRSLLRPANEGEELGDLVIEPVCVRTVTQADAIDICAADPDPLSGPFPTIGEHVWMEGRYVLDLEHGGWAELHPLYRWGPD